MGWSAVSVMGVLYWLYWIVAMVVMVRVLLRNRDTVKTLTWIMVFIFIPFLGLLLYFFFGRDTRRKRLVGKRLLSQIKQHTAFRASGVAKREIPADYQTLATLFENVSSASLLPFDEAEVIPDTRGFAERLFEIIYAAENHIHLQFYIIEEDDFGCRLRDALVEKARQGVEVRLIYDCVGCWKVKERFFESMRSAGVCVESFLKVFFPLLSSRVNYRNHRKLVVVDGKVGMVGGCNIAERLFEIIYAAENHIHLQLYIIEEDDFGCRLRDALVEKARQGVEVRLIYDCVGCWKVKERFFDSMRSAGVCVESFLKVFFPLLSSRVNYRNHRKLVVVDGKVGLVGGCNIADRYLEGINGGCWRDTMLLLRGAAVKGLQASFVVDWYFANRSKISGERYFPLFADAGRKSYVQVVTSNPVGNLRVIIAGYIKILSQARGYVYLQTPYFMPDETFLQALKSASMSGVDVRLMIPEHSDSRIADYATTSHLGELLESGIKVFLYRGGVLHSKSVVCDDYVSSIGSANLDFRSFFYNFEISAFVYDRAVAVDLKECFINDMKRCRQLTLNEYRTRPFIRRCTESLVKLLSPLL